MAYKIIFLAGIYPSYGGVEKVTTTLANEFHKRGCKVTIVSFEQPHLELLQELECGIELNKLDYPVASKRNIEKLKDIIKNIDADILINQWCIPFYVTWICNKAINGTKCKLISVHHNLPNTNKRIKSIEDDIATNKGISIINKLKLFAVKQVSRLSLYYALTKRARFVVLSKSFVPLTREFLFNTKSDKIISIGNPLTIETTDNICEKENEIIYVGRIEENQKRTKRLIDIWSLLEDKHPDWRLTIIGDGPDKDALSKYCNQNKLKRVTIEGYKEPLPYYKRAKIILLVSEYEGFGLVISEGMEYGCIPMVYDSYLASHDLINHQQNGFLIPQPFADEKFAKNIELIMKDELLRREMSSNAKEKAKEFSPKEVVNKWFMLFNDIKQDYK